MGKRTFLVEAYTSRSSDLARLREQVQLTEAAAAGGVAAVRHVRSMLVAEDEVCLHVFEAESADALARAVGAAEMTAPRVVEVTLLPE